MKWQRGYIGKGLADAMTALIIGVAIVSAVGGWALIEGAIWVFSHISWTWN